MTNVHVVGAGGVGFWLATALAQERVKFTLWDSDTLEGGLGYTRLPKASPTTYKVDLLRGFCVAVLGCEPPKIMKYRFDSSTAQQIITPGDLVVDCTDMELNARKFLWNWTQGAGARMVRVSYDGRNDTVVVAQGLPLASRPGGGYAEVPSLALSFVAGGIGAIVVKKLLEGLDHHVEFQISVKDLVTPVVNMDDDTAFLKAVEEATDPYNPHDHDIHDASCNGMSPCDMVSTSECLDCGAIVQDNRPSQHLTGCAHFKEGTHA